MDDRELKKEAIKEAMREWLAEEKRGAFESVGKYIVNILAVAAVAALCYWILFMNGWRH